MPQSLSNVLLHIAFSTKGLTGIPSGSGDGPLGLGAISNDTPRAAPWAVGFSRFAAGRCPSGRRRNSDCQQRAWFPLDHALRASGTCHPIDHVALP